MRLLLLLATVLFLSGVLCAQPELDPQFVIPGQQLHDDLAQLRDHVLRINPDPFIYTSPERFETAFERALVRTAEGMPLMAFAAETARFLFEIGDSHTLLQYYPTLEPFRQLGHGSMKLDLVYTDSVFVVKNDRQELLSPLTQIRQFNQLTAENLRSQVSAFSIREGESPDATERVTDVLISAFAAPLLLASDSVALRVLRPDGVDTTVYYPLTDAGLKLRRKKNESGERPYMLQLNREDDTAVLQIKTFDYRSHRHYRRYLRKAFKRIKQSGASNLVLDVRDNTGGHSNRVSELLSYVYNGSELRIPANLVVKQSDESKARFAKRMNGWNAFWLRLMTRQGDDYRHYLTMANLEIGQTDTFYFRSAVVPKKRHFFTGSLGLFMNGLTGSGGANLAAVFKTRQMGVIYGESCLGPLHGTWGNPVSVKLNHTGLQYYVASIRFNLSDAFDYPPQAVQPDVFVNERASGSSLDRDLWLDAFKRHQSHGR
jgi:hypothetical protein